MTPTVQGGKSEGLGPGVKLDRKESYKAQRKNYRKEKKRVEKELLSTFQVRRSKEMNESSNECFATFRMRPSLSWLTGSR